MEQDIRWKQRYNSYKKALGQLTEFIEQGELNKFELQGLIQCFEYNYEIAWNLMKDYLQSEGNQNINGSKSAIMEAFKIGLIEDGEAWMEMFKDRNKTSHTYNEDTANDIVYHIYRVFYPLFLELNDKFEKLL